MMVEGKTKVKIVKLLFQSRTQVHGESRCFDLSYFTLHDGVVMLILLFNIRALILRSTLILTEICEGFCWTVFDFDCQCL